MNTEARQERITTPCPACGAASLFIGAGGHLTCAVLSCPEPGAGQEIENLKATLEAVGHAVADTFFALPSTSPERRRLEESIHRIRRALRQRVSPLAFTTSSERSIP